MILQKVVSQSFGNLIIFSERNNLNEARGKNEQNLISYCSHINLPAQNVEPNLVVQLKLFNFAPASQVSTFVRPQNVMFSVPSTNTTRNFESQRFDSAPHTKWMEFGGVEFAQC